MNRTARLWKILTLLVLTAAAGVVWQIYLDTSKTGVLTVAFLDVGQGDAIFIESPTGRQILVDGGPPHAILSELTDFVPWYDRSIDMLVVTNPDADHYAGFIDVLERYSVKTVLEPGTKTDTATYGTFTYLVEQERAEKVIARRGQIIDIGGGAYIRILFPDKDVSESSRNDGSIIAELVYGETEVLLTGDTTQEIEKYVTGLEGEEIQSDVVKIAHHGSRTSTADSFVAAVKPEYAIISAAKDSKYGHPHKETLETLSKYKVEVLGTYERGTVVLTSDGATYTIR